MGRPPKNGNAAKPGSIPKPGAMPKIKSKAQLAIDAEVEARRLYSEASNTDRKYYCTCCGKGYSTRSSYFSKSTSVLYAGNDGYINVCKSCMEAYYKTLLDFFMGDAYKAIERLCQLFDFYYIDEAVKDTTNALAAKGTPTRISLYTSRMIARSTGRAVTTDYLQTLRDRAIDQGVISSIHEIRDDVFDDDDDERAEYADEEDFQEPEFVVTRDIVRTWSTGMTPDEYEYLETQYADWISKVKVDTKSQEELIRAICIAQLNVRRAQAGMGKVSEAMKTLTDLMASCNLTPRQTNDAANVASTQLALGQLIKKIEETEPIGEPEEQFKDPDGIRKYIYTYFLGPLCRAIKIKNPFQQYCDEELEQLTVTPSEVAEATIDAESILAQGAIDNSSEVRDAN